MIKIVDIPSGTVLPKEKIKDALDASWMTNDYTRFNLGSGAYIAVSFERDKTIFINTNSRDLMFYDEAQAVMRVPTLLRVVELLFRWLPKLRK